MIKIFHHLRIHGGFCDAKLKIDWIDRIPEGWNIKLKGRPVFFDENENQITHCPECGEKLFFAHCAFVMPAKDRQWDDVAQPVQNNPGNFAPAHGIGKGRITDERISKVKANRQKSH